jgi:adenine deaminase
MVTLNPAEALHIDQRVGSMAAGKDADLVLWNAHPLSVYAKPLHTWVDGRMYFDLERDRQLREAQAAERSRLVTKMMQSSGDRQAPGRGSRPPRNYHCDDVEEDFSGAHED